jgi:1-acyl-sn-glycerol-3-phosphate acyltransferase
MNRHQRLQRWSLRILERRASQLLGLRLHVTAEALVALEPAPAIVLCRHVSVFDASIPGVLYGPSEYNVQAVIMAELLADPGFDLLYARLGSVFIPRENGPEALEQISQLGQRLGGNTVAVLFPEGRLFRPELARKILDSIKRKDPERYLRVKTLTNVLPPRSGGFLALLATAPAADVVVVAHAGFEHLGSVRQLASLVPLAQPINVHAWRIPRAEIPTDLGEQAAWLDRQWLLVDQWITANADSAPADMTAAG